MSHDLLENDTMFSVKQVPWHGLGSILQDAPETSEEAIRLAGLDWKAEKKAMYLGDGSEVPDAYAIVRDTDNAVLGTVGNRYTILQNEEAFGFFDPLITDKIATYETAGSLSGGRRVWILAKMDGEVVVGDNDKVDKYVLLSNTHDGTGSVIAKITPVRVVCNNTLTAAIRQKGRKTDEIKLRHTKTVNSRVKQASQLLQTVNDTYKQLEEAWRRMAEFELTPVQVLNYFESVLPDPEGVDNPYKTQQKRIEFHQLMKDSSIGGTLSTAENTLWGAFNAVTAHATHVKSQRKGATDDKHLSDLWFGSRHNLNNKAFDLAVDIMQDAGVNLDLAA